MSNRRLLLGLSNGLQIGDQTDAESLEKNGYTSNNDGFLFSFISKSQDNGDRKYQSHGIEINDPCDIVIPNWYQGVNDYFDSSEDTGSDFHDFFRLDVQSVSDSIRYDIENIAVKIKLGTNVIIKLYKSGEYHYVSVNDKKGSSISASNRLSSIRLGYRYDEEERDLITMTRMNDTVNTNDHLSDLQTKIIPDNFDITISFYKYKEDRVPDNAEKAWMGKKFIIGYDLFRRKPVGGSVKCITKGYVDKSISIDNVNYHNKNAIGLYSYLERKIVIPYTIYPGIMDYDKLPIWEG